MKHRKALIVNRARCIVALAFSILMVLAVSIGVVRNLMAVPDEYVQEVGYKTFRMFTVLSNILVASCAFLAIPFEIDGLRHRNYHLPRWIIELIFVGVTGVALTFVVTIAILGPYAGYKLMLFERSNLFLHTICPILSILFFIFVNDDHTISFKSSILAMIPMMIYSVLYMILAIFIGEENGGWRDHYRFTQIKIGDFTVPWPLVLVGALLVVFGILTVLRLIHNKVHKIRKQQIERYYQLSDEFNYDTIQEAITKLAQDEKKYDKGGEVTVPRRIIKMMEKKYKSNIPLNELCIIYLNEYLNKEDKEEK